MIPSRYVIVDERYPHPVKRRVRGPRDEKRSEPAITLLPPDPYLIMERPSFVRSPSPTMYRTAPPKSAKNKEASSFVILGETINTPVQSRPGSPSGRVSPFRGHGFKSPTTTRPNSRAPSPSDSPKKLPSNKPKPVKITAKPRVGRDIGLPPKSPVKSKPPLSKPPFTETAETPGANEEKAKEEKPNADEKPPSEGESGKTQTTGGQGTTTEKVNTEETKETTEKPSEPSQQSQKTLNATKQRLTPAIPRDKKPPVSPTPKTKVGDQQSVIKKGTKPPIPPKKVGMKSSLKPEGSANGNKKGMKEGKLNNAKEAEKKKEEPIDEAILKKEKENEKEKQKEKETDKEKDMKENQKKVESAKEIEKSKGKPEVKNVEGKKADSKPEEIEKPENRKSDEKPVEEKKPEKLIPCFQPDKCQIAPPTMASPSPIITPTISTPSTTPDLAASSTKNSQSIATAPTTVTPSTLTSVSSTLVLTGNLARNKSKGAEAAPHREKEPEAQMVKPARKDSGERGKGDASSGEITSATKLIKAEPEMEVLSPNDLRDSPPRVPPPNLAWDEGRLPNGDVPNKAETEGKLRRFISAVWRFLSYVFCCRCLKAPKCCRRDPSQPSKPSVFSRLRCCCCSGKSCGWNPFKRCTGCCKSRCEGKKCCGRKAKPGGNSNPKPRKCCAKGKCSCKGCCDKIKARCLDFRFKINNVCRSLFCLNMMCCQNFLRKFKFCHKFKCCQKNGFCSCCNPNVKREVKKLNKKGSRASNNSRDKDNLDVVLVEHTSLMKAAIPVLPPCLAIFCLILNLFVPGSGTFLSGIFCLCFGKPRFSVKDSSKNRFGSFILNTIIGVAQLFTVIFCLVGWGWSIWWGVIMYKLSRRQRRLKLAEKNQKEAEGSNVNHNHVDVEQG